MLAVALALLSAPALADHNDHEPSGGGPGDHPNAVGVDSHSRTYVGFARGPGLARFAAGGKELKSWPLPGAGPVNALDVTGHDRVWITDGSTARLIGRDGNEEQSLRHGPEDGCPLVRKHRPRRYGGIESWHRFVFVANRCEKTVEVFRYDGQRLAVLRVPGRGYPRGLAFDPGPGKRPARLYVSFPDRSKVLAFDAKLWRTGEKPVKTLKIRRLHGGKRTEPAGIVVDKHGQLVVSDIVNHALYFYDSHHAFSRYRVLGHPSRPGARVGRLHRPAALAQHRQDGSRSAGALVIADAGNDRVQRWNTYGYTYWSKKVQIPGKKKGKD